MVVTGTPGIEGLLLRSGRISEGAWSTVRACDTTHEHLATELVDRGLVGTGELEVISLSALFDAAFALSLAVPDSWEVTDPVSTLHHKAGITRERLLGEVSRRITLPAGEPGSVAALARTACSRRPPHPTPCRSRVAAPAGTPHRRTGPTTEPPARRLRDARRTHPPRRDRTGRTPTGLPTRLVARGAAPDM